MGFGSSKSSQKSEQQSTSVSKNQAYPFLSTALGGQVGLVGSASNAIANLLGLNGSGAQTTGFDNFRNSSSYDFIKNEGIKGITATNAAKGQLGSGAALKGIADYSTNLANKFLDSYLAQLGGLSNTGLSAAQIIGSAGNTANSQSTGYSQGSSKSTNFSLG